MMFDVFYKLYPRKQASKDAMKAWSQMRPEDQKAALDALPNHIKLWWTLETEKHFIPLPASWLRGRRWDDEIEIPEPKKAKVIEQAWWSSNESMLAEGLKYNTRPKPGESWFEFKGRLIELKKQVA